MQPEIAKHTVYANAVYHQEGEAAFKRVSVEFFSRKDFNFFDSCSWAYAVNLDKMGAFDMENQICNFFKFFPLPSVERVSNKLWKHQERSRHSDSTHFHYNPGLSTS